MRSAEHVTWDAYMATSEARARTQGTVERLAHALHAAAVPVAEVFRQAGANAAAAMRQFGEALAASQSRSRSPTATCRTTGCVGQKLGSNSPGDAAQALPPLGRNGPAKGPSGAGCDVTIASSATPTLYM
jgi:hypothetical protein